VAELEWGKEGYEQRAISLATTSPVDWVLAADCLYIDNVSGTWFGLQRPA